MKHADENIYIFPTFSGQLAASVWFPFKGSGVCLWEQKLKFSHKLCSALRVYERVCGNKT